MRQPRWVANIRLGIKNLALYKMRSLLTMLGVVFGVSSVIAMLAVGEGASQEALEQIRKLGSNNIILTSARPSEQRNREARIRMNVYGLLYDDAARVAEGFDAVTRVVPAKLIEQEGRLGERSLDLRVVGTTPAWFELVRRRVIAGRPLHPRDLETRSPVVVLTEHGARRLLATAGSIGESLRIGGNYFEVVGIVRSESVLEGEIQSPDREVDAYVPLDVARERFGDVFTRRAAGSRIRELVELHMMIVELASLEEVEPAAAGIRRMLERFHRSEDYRIHVPLALLRQAEATKRTFNIVLGSIAAISLLVGGIGIMNIMLATVTERTREIGIRRAIGAKRRQILGQFLIETAVLSTTGGLIGIALGLLIPWLITRIAGMPTVVSVPSLLLSLGISLAVGIVFGLYPAFRAARLNPIEALRYE
jgi:putative ABC transport system permease protein